MSADAKPFPITPVLPESAHPFLAELRAGLERSRGSVHEVQHLLRTILCDPALATLSKEDRYTIQLFFEILEDLVRQGWNFEYHEDKLIAAPPGAMNGDGADRQEIKHALRASLAAARDEQLREPPVRRFILAMERARWHRGRQVSVLNLFVSPQAFAHDLQRRLEAPESIRDELLQTAIQPYLQLATDDHDDFTGLRLIDIWRYCRYTWSLPLSSQPGRQARALRQPLYPRLMRANTLLSPRAEDGGRCP